MVAARSVLTTCLLAPVLVHAVQTPFSTERRLFVSSSMVSGAHPLLSVARPLLPRVSLLHHQPLFVW
jgi:hypothetical protein